MRWYGVVGYASTEEVSPGVWKPVTVERTYYGDLNRVSRSYQAQQQSTNDNLQINNEISIIADGYAFQNFHLIKYVEWMGVKWKVSSATVERPRITLSIGGVYNADNGPKA